MTTIARRAQPHKASVFVRHALAVAAVGSCLLGAGSALAQSSGCQDIQKLLSQRKAIADRISAATKGSKKQIDAKFACGSFGQLVSNGQTLLAWVNTNKDWCQIPDNFIQSIQADHGRATTIRSRACGAAAKQAQMEKQARDGASSGLLGGPGLTGQTKLPQGAL